MTHRAARGFNLVLGAWLFISAWLWLHSPSQFSNTWIVGALSVLFAAIAFAVPMARFLNTAIAVWLFISVWALPEMSDATQWNNAIVAVLMFVVSLVGTVPERHERVGRPIERRPIERTV